MQRERDKKRDTFEREFPVQSSKTTTTTNNSNSNANIDNITNNNNTIHSNTNTINNINNTHYLQLDNLAGSDMMLRVNPVSVRLTSAHQALVSNILNRTFFVTFSTIAPT